MADESVAIIRDLSRRVAELERQLANLPVRFNQGGAGGDSLPPGGQKFDVLQRIDDVGTVGWGPVRFQKRS